ncbi:MAG: hypothetical protein WA634_17855 [Silvibacterium sp.]
MSSESINRYNVGRIAERIVANELEFRGYRVSDLNKDGTSANADLLAAKDGKTWQIQVKGATEDNGWWVGYGYCNESVIAGEEPMFNKHSSFYKAQVVVLVSVKSPKEYDCVVMDVDTAEKAAQINLGRDYRTKRKNGEPKKPGPVWIPLDHIPDTKDASKKSSFERERGILILRRNNWNFEAV